MILGSQLRAADKYDALSKIAPTVRRPRREEAHRHDAVEIGPERMDEAAADWIFTGVYGAKDKTKRDSAEANPLWKGLEAVKQGRAKDVPDETWYPGLGVTAADKVLDDLRGLLVKQRRPPTPAATPAPWPGRRAVGPWGGRHGR